MGLGRDYREMILEQEHRQYYESIRSKEEELLESEERFLKLYHKRVRQNASALLAALAIVLGSGLFVVWMLSKLLWPLA
jgi:hypothetical protein